MVRNSTGSVSPWKRRGAGSTWGPSSRLLAGSAPPGYRPGVGARLEPEVGEQLEEAVPHGRVEGLGDGNEFVGAGALDGLLELRLHLRRRAHGSNVEHRVRRAIELRWVAGRLIPAAPLGTQVDEPLQRDGELPPRRLVRAGHHDVDPGHGLRRVDQPTGRLGTEGPAAHADGVPDLVGHKM